MSVNLITATSDTFEELVASSNDLPLLIDFWADWCGPCNAFAPVLARTAIDYTGRLNVAKLDIVAHNDVAAGQAVQTIPLLVIYRHGKEVARSAGAMSTSQLSAFIDQHLT